MHLKGPAMCKMSNGALLRNRAGIRKLEECSVVRRVEGTRAVEEMISFLVDLPACSQEFNWYCRRRSSRIWVGDLGRDAIFPPQGL